MEGNTHKYVAEEGSRGLFCCRAPHGARGLKPRRNEGAKEVKGRAPHGARGLKLNLAYPAMALQIGRAPHGARGLKPANPSMYGSCVRSRPAWGAWIETLFAGGIVHMVEVAPRMGRVD